MIKYNTRTVVCRYDKILLNVATYVIRDYVCVVQWLEGVIKTHYYTVFCHVNDLQL
jgi:hypothetical protein